MARIVFGLATSRSPLLAAGPHVWSALGARDQSNRRLRDGDGRVWTYADLAERAGTQFSNEVTSDVWSRKYDSSQLALNQLKLELANAKPDVVVVMGDDEEEYIHDDLRPAITVYRGQTWQSIPRTINPDDPISRETAWQWGREPTAYPVAADIAEYVLHHLIEAEFDVADSVTLQAMAHGFGFMYERLFENVLPIVPLIVNVHTPPAQPTPRRCYLLGRAVRNAIESWPADVRVAVIATGGLSVGIVSEALDRRVLQALQQRDLEAIQKLPRAWMQESTGEVLLWITAAGALEHLPMHVLDYIPAIRSPAGTGSGLGFAFWK
jgi:3-O-methylgallate 3,4-dioxygenase